jgi:hypothetical protein
MKFRIRHVRDNVGTTGNVGPGMKEEWVDSPNREALLVLYSTLGQNIQILEEQGPPKPVVFEDGNKEANDARRQMQPPPQPRDPNLPPGLDQPPEEDTSYMQQGISPQTIAPFRAPLSPEQQIPVPKIKPIEFEDNGVKFRVDNNVVYKKVWVELSEQEQTEYRITGDPTRVQKLDWQKIGE